MLSPQMDYGCDRNLINMSAESATQIHTPGSHQEHPSLRLLDMQLRPWQYLSTTRELD
jgi:hypothetical protein